MTFTAAIHMPAGRWRKCATSSNIAAIGFMIMFNSGRIESNRPAPWQTKSTAVALRPTCYQQPANGSNTLPPNRKQRITSTRSSWNSTVSWGGCAMRSRPSVSSTAANSPPGWIATAPYDTTPVTHAMTATLQRTSTRSSSPPLHRTKRGKTCTLMIFPRRYTKRGAK